MPISYVEETVKEHPTRLQGSGARRAPNAADGILAGQGELSTSVADVLDTEDDIGIVILKHEI